MAIVSSNESTYAFYMYLIDENDDRDYSETNPDLAANDVKTLINVDPL